MDVILPIIIAILVVISIGYFYSRSLPKVSYSHLLGSDIKMIFIVRTDLGMNKGKIAAQCCHGCLSLFKKYSKIHIRVYKKWFNSGQKKIVVRCNSEDALLKLAAQASASKIPFNIVIDAGHTQVDPDSKTVLALGPACDSILKPITGQLKLL